MKKIPLSQGKFALVDDEDYEWLSQWKWHAAKCGSTYYAMRHATSKAGKRTTVLMHAEMLGKKDGYIQDHRDGDGLNNQRLNLRYVTRRQNNQNKHIKKSSRYPGVYWDKDKSKWRAQIRVNNKNKTLGRYKNEYKAFLAYKRAVKELFGEDVIYDANTEVG